MSKHTPGPWSEVEGFIVGKFESDGEVHDICDPRCAPPDPDTMCEMDANARLIAAAPALYDLLLEAVQWIGEAIYEAEFVGWGGSSMTNGMREFLDAASKIERLS